MTEELPDIGFRRILVALDTSNHSRAALQAAAYLAKLSEAELRGLYVSDATWHQISRLSLISEVSELTGEPRTFSEEDISRQSKLVENRIRDLLKQVAGTMEIPHTLDSVQGSIEDELIKASEEADLITIGRAGHSHKQESKLGKTARFIVRRSSKPVLMLEHGLSIGGAPVICIYDGTEQAQRSLELALKIARKSSTRLLVIGLANQSDSVNNRNKEIEERVQNASIPVRLHLLKQHNIWNVTRLLNKLYGSLLVMPKDQPLIREEWAGKIFHMAKCPLLLIS
ncbi:universal stress protein [Halalkalibaculum sp. DA3122]|uniref:universal stress protein n=1 Tax=unclassified Halalkalibaculum TaxID=2964617 RepID=UPI0037542162